MDMDDRYSVLMSVYRRDDARYLKAAIDSILQQTLKAYDIVLVCDGPLTDELEQTISHYASFLTLVRLSENRGLGAALSEGIKHCQCDWIARMDSDDIAARNRCELQMEFLSANTDVDVLSGAIAEFEGECMTAEEASARVSSYRVVPQNHGQIEKYIKSRNPINHPCVMFRKSRVLEAGGYQPCPLFEDYDLWVRMFLNHCRFANLAEPILYMRVNGMHKRRGGIRYVKAIAAFWTGMYCRHVITLREYIQNVIVRSLVSLMPNQLRKIIYNKKLRK